MSKSDIASIVFLLGHDSTTVDIARRNYSPYTWAYAYCLPTTYYFETYFYSHVLGTIMDELNIVNATWIGSISWKADWKTSIDVINAMITDPDIHADLLGFWEGDGEKSMSLWEQADYLHVGLMDLMVYILQSMGESMFQIEKMKLQKPAFKPFFAS